MAFAICGWELPHVAQHCWASGSEESDHKHATNYEKNRVKNGRVIKVHGRFHNLGISLPWNPPGQLEPEFDHEGAGKHGGIKGRQEEPHHFPSVVLAVDVEDRNDDQVREDEGDDTSKTDPSVPQHPGQGNVPY